MALIRAHVLAGERIHGDDTTVPVLASPKTPTGRLWAYVRDDRPFGGPAPQGVIFAYPRDRGGAHPCRHLAGYAGILQADAYAGFNEPYDPARKPAAIIEAACWAHGRRKLFVLAVVAKAPLAVEAVRRIDAIFAVERNINGLPAVSAWLHGTSRWRRSSLRSKRGCAANAAGCRAKLCMPGCTEDEALVVLQHLRS